MPSLVEKDLLEKIRNLSIPGMELHSLEEVSDQIMVKLFLSLFTIYDNSWSSEQEEEEKSDKKQVKKTILRYLRLMDVAHLVPGINALRPGNPAILRCLGAVFEKLEDKYGGRLKQHSIQVFKSNNRKKAKLAVKTTKDKPDTTENNLPLPPKQSHLLPTTPSSAVPTTPVSGTKLLNGKPITPGSELRGRELARTPQSGEKRIQSRIFRQDLFSNDHASPDLKKEIQKKEIEKKTHLVQNPQKETSDNPGFNTIPTGKQLARTPPVTGVSIPPDNNIPEPRTPPIRGVTLPPDNKIPEPPVESTADIAEPPVEHSADIEMQEEGQVDEPAGMVKALEFEELEGRGEEEEEENDAGIEMEEKDEQQSNKDGPEQMEGVTSSPIVASRNDHILATKGTHGGVTPVALNCPENLQCTENDRQFLQHQQGIHEIRALEKKAECLKKELDGYIFKKGLLEEEYRTVITDTKETEKGTEAMRRTVRTALMDQTNQSPSLLSHSQKEQLLSRKAQQVAARVSRVKKLVEKEELLMEDMDQTMNNTVNLEGKKENLEGSSQALRKEMSKAEEQLKEFHCQLRQIKVDGDKTGQDSSAGQDRVTRRLQALQERVQLARQRRRQFKEWFA